jgi:hypothetical protein
MDTNDQVTLKFLKLIRVAVSHAQTLKANGMSESKVDAVIDALESFGSLASSGKLPRASTGEVPEGTGLGLLRGISEWTEDDDLLDSVFEIEEYYKKKM